MLPAPASFAEISNLLRRLTAADDGYRAAAAARQAALTKPAGALGRLETLAVDLAGWSRDGVPRAGAIQIAIFAGTHGVARRGVSPYPSEVTEQMVANFRAGGAAINAIARANDLALDVVPLQLETPTGDISCAPAMSAGEMRAAFGAGWTAVRPGIDVLIVGEMGIANTTIAAALAARAFGGQGSDWAGAGTGLDAEGIARKAAVIDAALETHAGVPRTAGETLAALGGREVAAMAGAILHARQARIPVLLDGFVTAAALAVLWMEAPSITAHCIAGHVSAERGHGKLLARLELVPLLDLGMRLGEGSGAAVASAIVRAAVATHNEMHTFAEAGVATRGEDLT
jgi:nicotinate-nucleotide--dimethylbenzimidazole phosphoribosyltransferase